MKTPFYTRVMAACRRLSVLVEGWVSTGILQARKRRRR